jgi:hypothetical protein
LKVRDDDALCLIGFNAWKFGTAKAGQIARKATNLGIRERFVPRGFYRESARNIAKDRTERRPYQQVFNQVQRKIVEKAFAREIELHSYRFEL